MFLRPQKHEALLYFPAVIIGGMAVLGGLGWLYERTRKKVEHPQLGKLTFYGDSWTGLVPSYKKDLPPVRFELPGDKKGPGAEEIERFQALWARMPTIVELVRPHAVEEMEASLDASLGTDVEKSLKELATRVEKDPGTLDSEWILTEIGMYEGVRGTWHWCLEFGVGWDAEHSRSAYLDLDGRFLLYDLSCSVVDV